MSLRDVQEVVRAYDGEPGTRPLDARALVLTVGDLRKLLVCAERVASEEYDLIDYLGPLIRAHCRVLP